MKPASSSTEVSLPLKDEAIKYDKDFKKMVIKLQISLTAKVFDN